MDNITVWYYFNFVYLVFTSQTVQYYIDVVLTLSILLLQFDYLCHLLAENICTCHSSTAYDKSITKFSSNMNFDGNVSVNWARGYKMTSVYGCLVAIIGWKNAALHNDVIKGKNFWRYWPSVWGNHRSSMNSPYLQRPVTPNFEDFFDLGMNKRLSQQTRRRWFETSMRSLWIQGFKGFYSRKYNQLHTSGICGLLRLTSIYITYFVRIKPLVYTMIFQWYVTRLPRVIFNQSQMTRFYMSEISLKYFDSNLRAR